ncbi:MAG: inositol monophosphatase family protein [Promethearchaeota archaeon]|jgi:3'-phosphoadenosine 5'-phosphosulfate (PAPS) 3'-phosphatase
MPRFEKELKLAVNLVHKATEITEWFKDKEIISYKKRDQSPVTIADFASQFFIRSQLREDFPEDGIIAEEDNTDFLDLRAKNLIRKCFNELHLRDIMSLQNNAKYSESINSRQWTVDPIDGTIGFQKGLTYAVGVGFMTNSVPKICAIAIPNYKGKRLAIFSAEADQGAHVSYGNNESNPIRVSQVERIEDIRLCHSLHYDKPWVLKIAQSIGINNFIQIDSMAKFCMVADGSADLFIKPLDVDHSFSWDFLPGDLIVKEAGGEITDLKGVHLKFNEEKCTWTAPGLIASNGILQKTIIDLFSNEQN